MRKPAAEGAGRGPAAWLAGLLLASIAAAATAADSPGAGSAINYAFATELGSGVYQLGGRNLQVVRITTQKTLRSTDEKVPGIRLVLPLTAGFFDFTPEDAIGGQLPSRIDSISLTPGIELDFPWRDDWMFVPWLRAGTSFAQGASDGWLFSTGVRLERQREQGAVHITRLNELGFAVVSYRNTQPDDRFIRLRQAAEIRRDTLPLGKTRRLRVGAYVIADFVPDPPAIPLEAGDQGMLQVEAGFTLGASPPWRTGRVKWPRLGFGYRQAGDFSGWRIVIGAPF